MWPLMGLGCPRACIPHIETFLILHNLLHCQKGRTYLEQHLGFVCMPVLATVLPDSSVYILEPELLNILHQRGYFTSLCFPCALSCGFFQTSLYFDILANLPLPLNMVCILLELPDLLKAQSLCVFKAKYSFYFKSKHF